MTYKTCQNICSEHCHVSLEQYREGVAYVVKQMKMSYIYMTKRRVLIYGLNLILYKPMKPK